MFYQVLLIHLYRPFLKYTKSSSPLPQHVSPRKLCTQAASAISKLLRIYKRSYGFSQICNIAVYIAHTACTIHLLNLPEKNAQRDVVHGLRHLEEMAESWLCARRTLRILDISANKWQVPLPNEATVIFERTHTKWGSWGSWDQVTSPTGSGESPTVGAAQAAAAIPSRFSSPGAGVSQDIDPSAPGATDVVGAMPRYRAASSMQTALAPAVAAQRSSSAQIQPHETPLPEPTYLKPATHLYYPVQPGPLAQNGGWYGGPDNPLRAMNDKPSPGTDAPPITGFDPAENLVEESQDWWSRNPTTLNLGIENWDGWHPGMAGQPSGGFRYGPNIQQPTVDDGMRAPQPMRYPVGVPPNTNNSPGYNNLLFPRNFPQ